MLLEIFVIYHFTVLLKSKIPYKVSLWFLVGLSVKFSHECLVHQNIKYFKCISVKYSYCPGKNYCSLFQIKRFQIFRLACCKSSFFVYLNLNHIFNLNMMKRTKSTIWS